MSRLTMFLRGAHRSIGQRSKILRNEFAEHTKVVARMIERHNLPAQGWGAKGFEFWTFLSVLLARTNYLRILELGSGRSTIVFAEFAKFRNADVTSIETDRQWYNKARMELRWQDLSTDLIHLLKIDESVRWYNVEQFRSLARSRGPFDLVMIDGPNEAQGNSRGMRDSETGLREIIACCESADVIIIDDVHRRHILDSIDRMLSNPSQYERWFYDYTVGNPYPNSLCLCVRKGSRASREISAVLGLLGMRLNATLLSETCPED